MNAQTEIERRGAVATLLALLSPRLKDLLTDEYVVSDAALKRLQSWVFGGKLIKVSVIRRALIDEINHAKMESSKRKAAPDSEDETLRATYFRYIATQALESLVTMACSGNYENLEEAAGALDKIPSDMAQYDLAMEMLAKGEEPEYPPTLGDLYVQCGVELPEPQTAEEKVVRMSRKGAA